VEGFKINKVPTKRGCRGSGRAWVGHCNSLEIPAIAILVWCNSPKHHYFWTEAKLAAKKKFKNFVFLSGYREIGEDLSSLIEHF
jgi:hypothetical protein